MLGASGDLAARLLFPALLSLEHRERLEDLRIIGYARQEWTTDQFHENLRAAIDMHGGDVDEKYFDRFIDRIEFHGGDISVESLRGLHDVLDGPAIFYLALPPGVFADAAETIAKAGLADETNGWRRLVIEKPFGTDLDDARSRSTSSCTRYWREDQIFRIDHFLGKETVQNMLVFRFANRFIEPVLHAGARRRDPDHGRRDARRRRPLALLRRHRRAARHDPEPPHPDDDVRDDGTARAVGRGDDPRPQGRGAEGGAPRRSRASTPCAASTRPGSSKASRVVGVPRRARRRSRRRAPTRSRRCGCTSTRGAGKASRCCLRSGKRLAAKAHEVAFRFREPPTRLFRHTPLEHAEPNWLVFRMSPAECTELVVRTKQPGLELEARESVLRAEYATPTTARRARTSQLLLDVLEGDHTPFLRFDEVEWSWRIVDPILQAWKAGAPEDYVAGQRRPGGPAPLPRPRPLLAAAARPRALIVGAPMDAFDVVVVGAGSAGAVLAARLSEDPGTLGAAARSRARPHDGRRARRRALAQLLPRRHGAGTALVRAGRDARRRARPRRCTCAGAARAARRR